MIDLEPGKPPLKFKEKRLAFVQGRVTGI